MIPWWQNSDRSATLYQGETRAVMQALPEASVDLVFADPPYFLSNGGSTCQAGERVSVDKGGWDEAPTSPEDMHQFNLEWLWQCRRLLKPDGSIWVSGTHHVIHSVGFAMQQLGLKIQNDITWEKPNPPPNLGCRCFTHSTETLLWATRPKARYHFDYEAMREANGGKQMKSVWTLLAPGKSEKALGKHPTQKPLALLERILRATAPERAVVLDPFNGSGTTGVAAMWRGLRYIGIDQDRDYLELARCRMMEVGR